MGFTIERDLRTVPNIITLSRILLILVGAIVYFYLNHGLGIVLSIVAGVTDYLDGYVARRTGQVTRLGEILDQFCDLCFESFLIVIATVQHFFPPVIICAYLLREFWVAAVRRFMAAAHMNIPSSLAGKAKSNLIMWSFLPTYPVHWAPPARAGAVPGLLRLRHHRTGPAGQLRERMGLHPGVRDWLCAGAG